MNVKSILFPVVVMARSVALQSLGANLKRYIQLVRTTISTYSLLVLCHRLLLITFAALYKYLFVRINLPHLEDYIKYHHRSTQKINVRVRE